LTGLSTVRVDWAPRPRSMTTKSARSSSGRSHKEVKKEIPSMNHIFRRRGIVAGGIALTLAAALIGCSSASDDSGSTGGTSDDVTAVQSIRSMSNPYHANWADGGALFGDWADVEVVTIVDEGDSQTQLSKIRALGAEGK